MKAKENPVLKLARWTDSQLTLNVIKPLKTDKVRRTKRTAAENHEKGSKRFTR